jgi:invasion protein IalB
MKHRTLCLALFAALAVPGLALAAKPKQPAAAPAASGGGIGKYGDWEVRCFQVQSPAPCDMVQLLTQKNSGNRVMSLSIAFAPQAGRHLAQFVLPLGVSLPKGATLTAGSYTAPHLLYHHCNKTGCFIEGTIEDAIIDALGKSDVQAKMTIVSDAGKPFSIPFSLRGFAQAHDSMVALARQRATAKEAGK